MVINGITLNTKRFGINNVTLNGPRNAPELLLDSTETALSAVT